MAPRRKQAQETQTNPAESGSGSVQLPSSVSASVNSRAPIQPRDPPCRPPEAEPIFEKGVQEQLSMATGTITATTAVNDDSNDNSYDDDSNIYYSEGGDGVQSLAFTAERRAAIARLAMQAEEYDDEGKDGGPSPRLHRKWTSDKAKQPIYRLSSERRKIPRARRSMRQYSSLDPNPSRLSSALTPREQLKPRPTEAQYMKHMLRWKRYCTAHLDGDVTVTTASVLDYMETEVFTDTVIKTFKTFHRTAARLRYGWSWNGGHCFGSVGMDVNGSGEGDGGPDDESDVDMGNGGPAVIQGPTSKHGQRRTTNGTLIPRVALTGSIIDQDNVLLNAPVDGKGRKMIEIFPVCGTTETASKAMAFLWKLQRERTCLFANNEPSSRDKGLTRKAYRKYRERLVVSEEFKGSTRQAREPYTERQLITMLAYVASASAPSFSTRAWRETEEPLRHLNTILHIREHICLAARHSMILRDEDLRHLNLTDVISIDRTRSVRGSKRALKGFLAFQSQLLNAIEDSRLQANIIRTYVVTDGPTLTAGIDTVGTKIDQLSHMVQGAMEIRFSQLEGVVTGVMRRLGV
ncbi:hypothetical protein KI688_007309 [Linnemannia hyalina]|uniref:Uncharacterized protein n=1 Tax=Linnemannia hyalina TaxID=64524 RepID=A0A9P8BN11_9FUNG|nr:hypothetical protein KI688_007309 [Linnemannia hyalina]